MSRANSVVHSTSLCDVFTKCPNFGGWAHLANIGQLARDRLIWLAMLVEMAQQQMESAADADVQLTETLVRALPDPSTNGVNVPALITPNWSIGLPSLESAFESFGFAEWEKRFQRPALDGITPDVFFRVSDAGDYAINLDTREITPWREKTFGDEEFGANNVRLSPAASRGSAGIHEKPQERP